MTGPRYPRETFAPPESTFPASGDEPNGSGHGPNGAPEDNVDETRPRAFGVPGTGPAGGFEPRPFASVPLNESGPSGGHDGFSEPTLAGGSFTAPDGPPLGGPHDQGFGDTTAAYPGPPAGEAPPSFPEGPAYAEAPTSFAEPHGGYGLGDRPPTFDRPGMGPSDGFSEPTVGIAGPIAGPVGGMAPPMGPPPGVGAPTGARPRPQQRARGPRRAKLQLRHINPWTVLKFSCVLSVALFFVWLITIGLLYGILQAAGVIDHINNAVTTINGNGSKEPVTPGLVFGGSAILGVINVVLFIALSTVGSVVYNLCADLVGGIEVTLSERE
ncbi:MAG TPA: DUF3566 domain-containing protein [Jatrophihabitantaceae bacterium]|jgi:hypothetical protein